MTDIRRVCIFPFIAPRTLYVRSVEINDPDGCAVEVRKNGAPFLRINPQGRERGPLRFPPHVYRVLTGDRLTIEHLGTGKRGVGPIDFDAD